MTGVTPEAHDSVSLNLNCKMGARQATPPSSITGLWWVWIEIGVSCDGCLSSRASRGPILETKG